MCIYIYTHTHANRGHLYKGRVKDQLKGIRELAGLMLRFHLLVGP